MRTPPRLLIVDDQPIKLHSPSPSAMPSPLMAEGESFPEIALTPRDNAGRQAGNMGIDITRARQPDAVSVAQDVLEGPA